MTQGKIRLDMQSPTRTSIHQAFDVRINEPLGGVGIDGVSTEHEHQQGMTLFCENVYQSLFPIFKASVTWDECRDAVFVNDGQIDTAAFAGLASTLVGETFVGFEHLGQATREVYTDLENANGVVDVGLWTSHPLMLDLFCRRVILGTKIDSDLVVEIPGTLQSATVSCLDDLRIADGNEDGLLSEREYISLVNNLSKDSFLFTPFDQLPVVLQNNFAWLRFGADTVDIGGLDSVDSTESELRQLDWVCSQTEASISAALSRGARGTETPFLTECIIASIIADENEDGKLGFEEFKSVLRVFEYDEPDSGVLLQTFTELASEEGLIDVSGVGRYKVVTSANVETFEVLCNSILDLVIYEKPDITPRLATALNSTGDDLLANTTNTPSPSPIDSNKTSTSSPTTLIGSVTSLTSVPTDWNETTSTPSTNGTGIPSLSPTPPNRTASPTSSNVSGAPSTIAPTGFTYSSVLPSMNTTLAPSMTSNNFNESATFAPNEDNATLAPSSPSPSLAPTSSNMTATFAPSTANATLEPLTLVPSAFNNTTAPSLSPVFFNGTSTPSTMNDTFPPMTLFPTASNDTTIGPSINATHAPSLSPTVTNETTTPAPSERNGTLVPSTIPPTGLNDTTVEPSVNSTFPPSLSPIMTNQTGTLSPTLANDTYSPSTFSPSSNTFGPIGENETTVPFTVPPTKMQFPSSAPSSEESSLSPSFIDGSSASPTPLAQSDRPSVNPTTLPLPTSVPASSEPSGKRVTSYAPSAENFSTTPTQRPEFSLPSESEETAPPSQIPRLFTSSPSIQPIIQTPSPSTRAPTLPPTSLDEPTAYPTMPTESFASCKNSMFVCDRDRDNKLQSNEFVLFLNRQTDDAFKGHSFDDLPIAFQVLYLSVRQSGTTPSIFGSKPGQQATGSQINNLRQICSETDRVFSEYLQKQHFQPTVPPTHFATDVALQALITPSEFSQCKLFLFVSDGNRNSQLDSEEYVTFVNKITVNAFLGLSFADLPLVFRAVFETTSGTSGFISIVGARPGQQAPVDQVAVLENLCGEAYSAGEIWEDTKTTEPTLSPTGGSNGSSSTLVPTLFVENFSFCTTSMAVSDRNKDNFLDEDEYVWFLNRLKQNIYLGVPFSDINSSLQLLFFSLRDASGSISIPGARPGQPRTPEEAAWLRRVCSDTDTALSELVTTSAPSPGTIQPTVAPSTASPVGSSQRITSIQLARCRAFLSISDRDKNKAIDQVEYVSFLNTLSGNSFIGLDFSGLVPTFRQLFTTSQSASSVVSINGAKPSDGATPEEVASLTSFCAMVYTALDLFNNGPPPTQSPTADQPLDDPTVLECFSKLNEVDLSGDRKIDKVEYVAYVSQVSKGTYGVEFPFSSLPYVIQDNFDWIRGDNQFVDVEGVGDISLLNGTSRLASLARLCRRTTYVIESAMSGNNETEPVAHCYGSFTSSDVNSDNQLTETEFVSTVNHFLGLNRSELSFMSLDDPFVNFFEANKGFSNGVVNIEGSKPSQTPNAVQELTLTYLCDEIAKAVNESRTSYVLRNRCLDALNQANADTDSILVEDEYVDFVYLFAGKSRGNQTYTDLPEELLLNFEALRGADNASISITGWLGSEFSTEGRENIVRVCTATNDAIIVGFPSDAPTPTPAPGNIVSKTIYNGFILDGRGDLFASDLGGGLEDFEIAELNLAYGLFVDATVSAQLSVRRLRGRRLAVLGFLYESPTIHKILNGTCGDWVANSTKSCLEVYASFELSVTENEDVASIVNQYTILTQDSIANGALQSQLALLSPNRRFDVIGVTDFVLPDAGSPTSTPVTAPTTTFSPTSAPAGNNEQPRSEDAGGGGLPLIPLIAAGGGTLLIFAFVLFWFYYRRRNNNKTVDAFFGKDDVEGPHKDNLDENDDHDYELSLNPSESEDTDEFNAEPKTSSEFSPATSEHNDYGFSSVSEHSRTDVKFGRENDTDHPRPTPSWSPPESPGGSDELFKDEAIESNENDWAGAAGNLLGTGDDSEGSEESELVVRTSSAASVAARSMGSRENDSGPNFFNDTSSDEDDNEEESIGVPESEGGFATDMDHSEEGSETFNDGDADSFQKGSFGDGSSLGGDSRGGDYGEEYGEEYDEDYGDYDDDFEPSYDNQEDGSAYQGSLNTTDKPLEQDFDASTAEDDTIQGSYVMDDTGLSRAKRLEFRSRIEELVLQVVPDEVGNVDAMMEQFYGREEELIKTLSTMAKQVKARAGGDGPSEHGDNSYSDSYRSESMDGEGEVFDDEGYYNEPFETSAGEQYYDDDGQFGAGQDGEEYYDDDDDQFQDEDSYGSDYSDHDR